MSDPIKPNLPNFIRAVLSHWVGLMSGGVIIVALGIWERVAKQNVPLYLYLIITLLFIVLACFLAWKDAHNEMRVMQAVAEKDQAILKSQVEIKDIQLKYATSDQEKLSQEHEEAKEYIAQLEERLAPKLDILFEEKIPYVEYVQERGRIGRGGYWKVYRVGVKNISEDELFGISVEIENFETQHRTYENIPLRMMYDVGLRGTARERFSLRPERTQYVDVVMREMHPEQGRDFKSTVMCFTKQFEITNDIGLMEPITLNLVASANGAKPCRKQFVVYVDDEDQLQMKPSGDEAIQSLQKVGSTPSS